MKVVKSILAAVLAAAMCLPLAACGDTSWVAKTEDDTVSSGVYLSYLTTAYLNAQQNEKLDPEITDFWKQKIDDKSVKDYIVDKAMEQTRNYLAINKKFTELGLEFTDQDRTDTETNANYMWQYFQSYYEPNGTSYASYAKNMENSTKNEKIFDKYYDAKEGKEPISDDALLAHFKSNFADINYFAITLQDMTTGELLPAADQEAAKKKAEDYAAQINGGKAFNVVKASYTDEVAKARADADTTGETEYTPTDAANIAKDTDTKSVINKTATSPSEKFVSAIFKDVEVGKAKVIKDDKSYYVVMKYDILEDKDNFKEMRKQVLVDLKGTEFTELVLKWGKELDVTFNNSAISKYNPKNIKIEAPEQQ